MTIALMFLMKGDHSHPQLWYPFINSKKFTTYCHPKVPLKDTVFKQHAVKQIIPTAWGCKSLVKATLIMMTEGLKRLDNSHFVLLSDTCCPLFTPKTTEQKIKKLNDNVCLWFDQKLEQSRMEVPSYLKPHIVKHHQWIILQRSTVEQILKYDKIDQWKGFIPDEQYFGTMLNWLRIPFTSRMTTFANWQSGDYHPKSYTLISPQLRQKAKHKNSIFIRKIL